jgi:penicillin-binding protein 2
LDARLQQAAEEALGDLAGAVVALDPRNGEVLALASHPDYDLSLFANRILTKDWAAINADERHPMSNRALQGLYPPGSVFKIVTTAAGLETGAITPDTPANCLGIFWISTWPYRCWKEIGHASITLHRAIVESCDVFFYHVGLKVKVDQLYAWAKAFGLGEPSGIDLPGESSGLVPNAAWKEKTQHMPWFPGNTVMMSIGQGYLLATPMQLALMVSAVANGGQLFKPHLLKRVTDAQGRLLDEPVPAPVRSVPVQAETLRLIRRGMTDAVGATGGTAWRARVPGLSVAGKTGTAQNPHGEDHADFVCFAPAEAPRIVIAVVVENGGEGGLTAAPIARRLLEVHFGK